MCLGLARGLGAQKKISREPARPDSHQPASRNSTAFRWLVLLTDCTGEIPFVSSLLAAASYCRVCKVCIRECINNGNWLEFGYPEWPLDVLILSLQPPTRSFSNLHIVPSPQQPQTGMDQIHTRAAEWGSRRRWRKDSDGRFAG